MGHDQYVLGNRDDFLLLLLLSSYNYFFKLEKLQTKNYNMHVNDTESRKCEGEWTKIHHSYRSCIVSKAVGETEIVCVTHIPYTISGGGVAVGIYNSRLHSLIGKVKFTDF